VNDTNEYHPVTWLDEHGWAQGSMVTSSNRVCALGAIICAELLTTYTEHIKILIIQKNREIDSKELDLLLLALQETTGFDYSSIQRINDNITTTQEQVRQALVKVFGEPL
jgi:hypothetical protein